MARSDPARAVGRRPFPAVRCLRWTVRGLEVQADERQVVGLEHGSELRAGATGLHLARGAFLRFLAAV